MVPGGSQAMQSCALDHYAGRASSLYMNAHRLHRRQRVQTIFPWQKATDVAAALSNTAEQHCPMRHRLITGHGNIGVPNP